MGGRGSSSGNTSKLLKLPKLKEAKNKLNGRKRYEMKQ